MTRRVKTSIYIDGELWERLKERARSRSVEISRYLEDLIREELDSEIVDALGELIDEEVIELDFEPVRAGGTVSDLVREMRDERGSSLSRHQRHN